jgi:arylsulfatase A-like enzyme
VPRGAVWETSPVGPFDQWPTGSGFEHFYGFIGGEANQYYPALYEGTTPVEPPKTPEEGYHLTEDLADKAITWIAPAEGADARQAVLHVLRARRHPRPAPRAQGVVRQVQGQVRQRLGQAARGDLRPAEDAGRHPAEAELTERHEEIPAWDDVDDALKPVLARQMEVYAGFLERRPPCRPDHRLAGGPGILDDTLVY